MKAVIPAAGMGLRFLPLTKEQPKEMLPVLDRPTIQYVVEEAIAAGIDDIIIVTGREKRAIEDHFDKSFDLEATLERLGKLEELEEIRRISNMVDIHFIRQKVPRGLGDAVLCARKHVGDEPFAVMLGDTINISDVPVVKQLIEIHEKTGASVVAVEPVSRDKVRDYGIVAGDRIGERLIRVRDMVEKPSPKEAPSNMGITGTYVLSPSIFRCIEMVQPGANGEIQLTDALRLLLADEEVLAYEFIGRRYDIGDKIGWLRTTFELALEHPEYGPALRRFLKDLLSK